MIDLEAPSIQTNRHIIGEGVRAGEIEIDQAGQAVAEEENIVRKEICMNDPLREISRPILLKLRKLAPDNLTEPLLHRIGACARRFEQRPPPLDRKPVTPRHGEI